MVYNSLGEILSLTSVRALILCCRVMMQLSRDDNIVRTLEQFV